MSYMSDNADRLKQSRKNSFENFNLHSGARIVKNEEKMFGEGAFNDMRSDDFLNSNFIAQFFGENFQPIQTQRVFDRQGVFNDAKLEKPKSLLLNANEDVKITKNNPSDSMELASDKRLNIPISKLVILSNESITNQVEDNQNEPIKKLYRGTARTLLASNKKFEKQKFKSTKQEPKALSKMQKSVNRFFK